MLGLLNGIHLTILYILQRNTWSASNQAYGGSGTGYGSLTLSGNTLIYHSISGGYRRVLQVDSSTGLTTSATTSSGW